MQFNANPNIGIDSIQAVYQGFSESVTKTIFFNIVSFGPS